MIFITKISLVYIQCRPNGLLDNLTLILLAKYQNSQAKHQQQTELFAIKK